MTITNLKSQLSEYLPLLYQHDLNSEFRSVRVMEPGMPPSRGHELYIGTAGDFLRQGIPSGVRDILCLGTVEEVHAIRDFESCNILILPPTLSAHAVLNRVLEIMDASEKFAKCSDLLLHSSMLLRGDSFDLNRVMDAIYELLGNPISICNPDGTILCHKHMEDMKVKTGHLPVVHEMLPSSNDIFHKISELVDFNADPVVLDYFDEKPIKNVVSKLTKDANTVAYFVLIEINRKIDSTDIAVLKMVCEWLSAEFRKNSMILAPKRVMVSHFLSDLLSGTASDAEDIAERSDLLGVALKPNHCIVVVDIEELDFQKSSPHTLRSMIESYLTDSLAIIYNGSIVFYLNWEGTNGITLEAQKQLWELFRQYELKVGISPEYTKLQNTKSAYEQALAAIRLGRRFDPSKITYRYQEYALYHLLEHHQSASGTDLISFCDPELLSLIEYDDQTGNEYVYTTYILMQCGGKQTEAANALHIHRSTMLYRMERIIELTGWDFKNMATLTRLHISYAILVLNGRLDAGTYRI